MPPGLAYPNGDESLTDPDPNDPPPSWLTDVNLVNGVFYPAAISHGLLLCEKGGNILKIRVDGDNNKIFTFTIDRGISPTP